MSKPTFEELFKAALRVEDALSQFNADGFSGARIWDRLGMATPYLPPNVLKDVQLIRFYRNRLAHDLHFDHELVPEAYIPLCEHVLIEIRAALALRSATQAFIVGGIDSNPEEMNRPGDERHCFSKTQIEMGGPHGKNAIFLNSVLDAEPANTVGVPNPSATDEEVKPAPRAVFAVDKHFPFIKKKKKPR